MQRLGREPESPAQAKGIQEKSWHQHEGMEWQGGKSFKERTVSFFSVSDHIDSAVILVLRSGQLMDLPPLSPALYFASPHPHCIFFIWPYVLWKCFFDTAFKIGENVMVFAGNCGIYL